MKAVPAPPISPAFADSPSAPLWFAILPHPSTPPVLVEFGLN